MQYDRLHAAPTRELTLGAELAYRPLCLQCCDFASHLCI